MKTVAVLLAAALTLGVAPVWAQDSPPPPPQAEAASPQPKSAERLPPGPRGKQGREGPSLKYHTEEAKLDVECGAEEDLKSCAEIAVDFFRRMQKRD